MAVKIRDRNKHLNTVMIYIVKQSNKSPLTVMLFDSVVKENRKELFDRGKVG